MGHVRLRKMTLKSQMKFGKFHDLTIQDILNMDRGDYLVWVYYSCSSIDFDDEVLSKIGLLTLRIPKPGNCKEFLELHKVSLYNAACRKDLDASRHELKKFDKALLRHKMNTTYNVNIRTLNVHKSSAEKPIT